MELFDDDALLTNENAAKKTTAGITQLDILLERLTVLSPAARDDALHALLYGYANNSPVNPPLPAIKRFARKVLAAVEGEGGITPEEARRRVEQIRLDRLDPDTEQVHTAAYKVLREFDRLRGLLRFKPEPMFGPESARIREEGEPGFRYIAYCAPDHFVLPLLAEHFWRRFGNESGAQPWAIIDEKRNLALISEAGGKPVLCPWAEQGGTDGGSKASANPSSASHSDSRPNADDWEGLWKNYHRSINNESRANPKLQKQFMPCRYWKYLTEME